LISRTVNDTFQDFPDGIRLVPKEVWQECQALAVKRVAEMPRNYLAAVVIVIIWLLAIAGFMLWAWQFVSGIK